MIKRILAVVIASIFVFSACGREGKEDDNPSAPSEEASGVSRDKEEVPEEPKEEGPDLTGLAIDPLTGLYIDEKETGKRPYAVVINNLPKALPQSGISQADILYEVLAEGGITRLIAIFKDFDSKKIGSVRSTRPYFLDFAIDNDAIFVHHGGSEQGYADIRRLGYDHLDGMQLDGKTFVRDKERLSKPGMYEHSSFTAAELLKSEASAKGFRLELKEEYEAPFDFYSETDEMPKGDAAFNITVPFAPQSQVGYFEYDKEEEKYLRFQNGNKHIDSENNEQLKVNNIIIQYVGMKVIDNEGRREFDNIGSGDGLLITKGVSYPIKWSKAGKIEPTLWTDEKGDKIKLNPGKTWICVFQKGSEIIIEDGSEKPQESPRP